MVLYCFSISSCKLERTLNVSIECDYSIQSPIHSMNFHLLFLVGSRKRRDRFDSSSASEFVGHIQRRWTPQNMETINHFIHIYFTITNSEMFLFGFHIAAKGRLYSYNIELISCLMYARARARA